MPVLGHTFVGLATALLIKPSKSPRSPSKTPWQYLWMPVILAIAYLPDIVKHLLVILTGWHDARLFSHSILFATLSASLLAFCLSRMTPVSFSRGLWISLVSILLHDFLDLLQSTDRVPWWPFYDRSASLTYNLIPTDPAKEALLFLALFLIFVIVRHFTVTLGRNCENAIPEPHNNAHFKWVCRAMLAVIVLTATVTHYLRQVREHQLYNARLLVHLNDYYGSLKVLDRAEHWPSAAKPGRIEYLKAVAYSGLGDQTRAEQYYLRSYRINPYYFWCVADLAIFYASSERPVGERRHLVAPYLTRLQSEFTSHHYLQQILNTIKQKLR